MTTPKVSVIIPAFNSERWIGRAVASVLSQTEQDVEVIVVDDASEDHTRERVRAHSDPRVLLIESTRNEGPAAARNRGLRVARGTWIAFLDSDDWYDPQRLQTLLDAGREHGADAVSDDLWYIDHLSTSPWTSMLSEKRIRLEGPRLVSFAEFVDLDLAVQPIVKASRLRGRDTWFPEEVRYAEDWYVWANLLLDGVKWLQLPTAYYYYYFRPASLMRDPLVAAEQEYEVVQRVIQERSRKLDEASREKLRERLEDSRARMAYHSVIQPAKSGHLRASLKELGEHPGVLCRLLKNVPRIVRSRITRFGTRIRNDATHKRRR